MIGDKKILAVITARGGSKGVKGKNYRDLLGKPLFIWSIKAALQSEYIDYIFVSTNCPHVKKKLVDFQSSNSDIRLQLIERPDELCTDTSKNEEALIHAVQIMEEGYNELPDIVINLQPTSPVRKKYLIDDAIRLFYDTSSLSLVTVSKHTPLFMQQRIDGKIIWHFDRLNRKMRQNMQEDEFYFHDDGCLYLTCKEVLFSDMCRLDENPLLYLNDSYASLQIDTEEDFIIIENIMKEIHKSGEYISITFI